MGLVNAAFAEGDAASLSYRIAVFHGNSEHMFHITNVSVSVSLQ